MTTMHENMAEVLVSEEQIQSKIKELGAILAKNIAIKIR